VGGEVGFKDVEAVFWSDPRPIVADVQEPAGSIAASGNLDLAARLNGLGSIDQQIEERLAQLLFVRFDSGQVGVYMQTDLLFLKIRTQGPHHFVYGGAEGDGHGPKLARTGEVDEFID